MVMVAGLTATVEAVGPPTPSTFIVAVIDDFGVFVDAGYVDLNSDGTASFQWYFESFQTRPATWTLWVDYGSVGAHMDVLEAVPVEETYIDLWSLFYHAGSGWMFGYALDYTLDPYAPDPYLVIGFPI